MLSCKQVAHLASDYLDHQTDGKLNFKIRLHLMMCANCRRFIEHLRITTTVASKMAQPEEVDAESVLKRIRERSK